MKTGQTDYYFAACLLPKGLQFCSSLNNVPVASRIRPAIALDDNAAVAARFLCGDHNAILDERGGQSGRYWPRQATPSPSPQYRLVDESEVRRRQPSESAGEVLGSTSYGDTRIGGGGVRNVCPALRERYLWRRVETVITPPRETSSRTRNVPFALIDLLPSPSPSSTPLPPVTYQPERCDFAVQDLVCRALAGNRGQSAYTDTYAGAGGDRDCDNSEAVEEPTGDQCCEVLQGCGLTQLTRVGSLGEPLSASDWCSAYIWNEGQPVKCSGTPATIRPLSILVLILTLFATLQLSANSGSILIRK